MIVAPDPFVVSVYVNPVPLPPDALKLCDPRGATAAVDGDNVSPPPTEMLAVALFPSESTTLRTSVVFPVAPAVYMPLPFTLPPDPFVVSVYVNPIPLPPLALKLRVPSGATLADAGLIETPAPTVMVAPALLPSASVTVTTSVVLPVAPAVYMPLPFTLPPDPFVVSVYVNPVPLPPLAVKLREARGAAVAVVGEIVTPAPTAMVALALFPSESVARTTSVVLAVAPAT